MKKVLLAGVATALLSTAASAADLPRRAAPPIFTPIPVFTWTGFYAGLHTAYTFTDRQRITTQGISPVNVTNVALGRRPGASPEQDGLANIGGGFGTNYQFTPGSGFVVGAAFDISWTDLHKNTLVLGAPNVAGGPPNPNLYYQGLDYLGTVNGKLGYAFDRFLVYGTGGLAFGLVENNARFFSPAGVLAFAGGRSEFETGYNYGGGVEYAVPEDSFLNYFAIGRYIGLKSNAVTIKAEYIHYDLGSRTELVGAIPGVGVGAGYTSRFHTEGSIVRAGFNYKFGG